jgi:tetratricopeptide (TPR) repeat protein
MAMALMTGSRRNHALQDTATFAHVAERFRRAGDLHRAVALCRDGLKKFPTHVSARVTLGLALLDLAQYSQARAELQQALKRAPDNLAAIRGLAQLHDHPDEGSHLDDDEDLRAHNHWRAPGARPEAAADPEPFVPAAYAAEPVAPVHAIEAVELERPAPSLTYAPPIEIEHVLPVHRAAVVAAPAVVPELEPAVEPPARNWSFDADLAAYDAALPLNLAVPQGVPTRGEHIEEIDEIDEVDNEPSAAFEFATAPATATPRRTDSIAAAFEHLLRQVNNQRLMSA